MGCTGASDRCRGVGPRPGSVFICFILFLFSVFLFRFEFDLYFESFLCRICMLDIYNNTKIYLVSFVNSYYILFLYFLYLLNVNPLVIFYINFSDYFSLLILVRDLLNDIFLFAYQLNFSELIVWIETLYISIMILYHYLMHEI